MFRPRLSVSAATIRATITTLGGIMRRSLILSAACLLLAGAAVGCSDSYDDEVKGCAAALKAQYEAGGEGRPDACDGIKEDDYTALVAQAAMDHLGWTGEDGKFDERKMLEDVLGDEQP